MITSVHPATRACATLIAGLLLVWRGMASACSTLGPEPTIEELFSTADAVFVAEVVKTERVIGSFGSMTLPMVEGDVELVEVLKGDPPAGRKVRDLVFGPGNCSLGLLAGLPYLFLFQPGQDNLVLWPTGSRMFININGTYPKELLARLRALKPN